ncbi:MAG: TonB-dependent receptor [bacterium]|nr:TonB-dependent receptor [bacterium]
MRLSVFVLVIPLVLGFLSAAPAAAEVDPALALTVERLARQVQELERDRSKDRQRILELEERLAGLAAAPTAPGKTVLFGPDTAAGGGQGNLLNPEITAFVDLGGSLSNDGDNDARNRFNLREAEVDFRAAITPQADGVLVLAIGEEIEDPFGDVEVSREFELEEAYVNFHTLPWDLALKGGKFRNTFGRNNLLHTHDLPQVTRPLAVQAFLGPEGLATVGGSLSWLVPNPWEQYIEWTAEFVNANGGEESPILGGSAADNPALVSHLKIFSDVGDTGSLELGASVLYTHTSDDRDDTGTMLGADLTYLWRDPDQPDFRSLLLQGEVFWSKTDFADDIAGTIRDDNWGLYAFGQYQFAQNWYAGLRYDYTEFPNLDERRRDDSEWGVSAYLSWYLSEALRVRLEYQHLGRDLVGEGDSEDALLLGLTFLIGSHPGHPYWVNR